MPALNITFTEEELAGVRDLAAAEGKSIKAYVHDLATREHMRRVFVEGAVKYYNDHKAEFDEAFPESVPPWERKQEEYVQEPEQRNEAA